jgi:hypothetical protein
MGETIMVNLGDRVVLTRKKTINHFLAGRMSITGEVVRIDEEHYVGLSNRPIFVMFDGDGRIASYSRIEVQKI